LFNRNKRSKQSNFWGFAKKQLTQTSWTETNAAIGSHKEGASPKTLDELYQKIATKIPSLQKILVNENSRKKVYFVTDDNGIINICGKKT